MTNLFLDLAQESRLRLAQKQAEQASDKAGDVKAIQDQLVRRVEALALANQALLELIAPKLGISESQVLAKMEEIDRRDGVRDGKLSSKVSKCGGCGRPANTSRKMCVFCGTTIAEGPVFGKA